MAYLYPKGTTEEGLPLLLLDDLTSFSGDLSKILDRTDSDEMLKRVNQGLSNMATENTDLNRNLSRKVIAAQTTGLDHQLLGTYTALFYELLSKRADSLGLLKRPNYTESGLPIVEQDMIMEVSRRSYNLLFLPNFETMRTEDITKTNKYAGLSIESAVRTLKDPNQEDITRATLNDIYEFLRFQARKNLGI